ncbi:hypothetical protein [Enterococcus faecium]|uniref:hypothetical protein n=1 Tax=Enterococcus faecium TaxID=1352 RepID=UPI003097A891
MTIIEGEYDGFLLQIKVLDPIVTKLSKKQRNSLFFMDDSKDFPVLMLKVKTGLDCTYK